MTLEERAILVINMCKMEIDRQEAFMRCAEHHDNEHEWLKRYELQGVYETIHDILIGKLEVEKY